MGLLSRAKQRGSVVPFFVVMVILVAGLTSAMYFVKQHGEQVRKEQAIATYNQQQADKKAVEAEAASKSEDSDKTKDANYTDFNQVAVTTESELPTTGAEFKLNELVGVFMLSVSVVGYFMSCRKLVY